MTESLSRAAASATFGRSSGRAMGVEEGRTRRSWTKRAFVSMYRMSSGVRSREEVNSAMGVSKRLYSGRTMVVFSLRGS